MYKRKRPYNIDGIIFTPDRPSEIDKTYNSANPHRQRNTTYKNMEVHKWKSEYHMSVDLLIRKPSHKFINKIPGSKPNHILYYLFCGIKRNVFKKMGIIPVEGYRELFGNDILSQNYHPIQFSPSLNPLAYIYWHPQSKSKSETLDNTIGEFRPINLPDLSWKLMGIRLDRTKDVKAGNDFGNNFTVVAEPTFNNFYNPLTLEDLIVSPEEYKKQGYFQYDNSELHKPQRAFNSFVKSMILQKFKGVKWAADLASGKGQDLFRYPKVNIKNVLFIDKDIRALSELLNRKKILLMDKKYAALSPTAIYVQHLDLNDNWGKNIKSIYNNVPLPPHGVPLIICNLAFHYLIQTEKYLDNIIQFISKLISNNGSVVITTLDGEKVFHLLQEHNGKYDIYDDSKTILKYSIHSKYRGKKFSQVGQYIDVLLPFSAGERYTETLVNVNFVSNWFTKYGFRISEQGSFGTYLDQFAKSEAEKRVDKYKLMNADDKEYVSLYQYLILVKKK